MWEKCSGLWHRLGFDEYGALEVGSGLSEIGGLGFGDKKYFLGGQEVFKRLVVFTNGSSLG